MKTKKTKEVIAPVIETEDKEVIEAIIKIAGEEGKKLYLILKGKENVSEFDLAEKLNLTINQIRNLLYKFDKYTLVSSTRKKDRKKGWYIYYWTFNPYKVEDLIIAVKKEKLKRYQILLEREKNNKYYSCPKKCMRLSFEMAFENQFQCLECGQLLQPEDSEKTISNLKKEIEILEQDIKRLVEKRLLRVFEEEEKKPVKRRVKKKIKKIIKKKIEKIVKKKVKRVIKKKIKKIVKKKKVVKKKVKKKIKKVAKKKKFIKKKFNKIKSKIKKKLKKIIKKKSTKKKAKKSK